MRTTTTSSRVRLGYLGYFLLYTGLIFTLLLGALIGAARNPGLQEAFADWGSGAQSGQVAMADWRTEIRTLAAACFWVLSSDAALPHVPTNQLPSSLEPATISGMNSGASKPTA